LSLGIQSFDDLQLQKLGRIHDGEQARKAIETARLAGFENFNLDIMHGLPGQTAANALDDLGSAIAFAPNHISWYQLTIEPNTVFYRRPPSLPPENKLAEIQEKGLEFLSENDFERYEVSAYARHDFRSIHNLNYWNFGDYLGIGAGAHGKITNTIRKTIVRTRKTKQPTHYLQNTVNRDAELVEVSEADLPLEFLLNALRIKQGFTIEQFEKRTGVPFSTIRKKVECCVSKNLMLIRGDQITTTEDGYRLLNSVLEEFL
jgi:oxygen-independent coproporphyrinogen-3 oxidase